MSIVSAYVDLPKGETVANLNLGLCVSGDLKAQTGEGLDVTWLGDEPP